MNRTKIEWTHRPETGGAAGGFTWNPIRARRVMLNGGGKSGTFCTRISPGCQHCYASVINKRFGTGMEYTVPNLERHEFFIDDEILQEPLRRQKPATIFVGDMFDLFHEAIPERFICEVLEVAGKAKQHTFQFLTKRAERMSNIIWAILGCALGLRRPPGNMWFGVSVENQEYADKRIPLLLGMPAAVRFVSVEPMLGPVDFAGALRDLPESEGVPQFPKLDWVICGGESGPGARPFDVNWAWSLLEQCKAADVPFFMKQLGSNSFCQGCKDQEIHFCGKFKTENRKGGDPAEWPEHLRVREFPNV